MYYTQTDADKHTHAYRDIHLEALTLIVWHHIGILLVVHLLGVTQWQRDLVLNLQIPGT